jgi:hypothetical protein
VAAAVTLRRIENCELRIENGSAMTDDFFLNSQFSILNSGGPEGRP